MQSESTESMTPYQYAYNLPNMRNDPTGAQVPMAHEVVDLEKVAHYEEERERNLMYSQYATRAYQGKLQEMVDANNDVEQQNYDNIAADAAEAAGVVWSANGNQNSIQGFLNVINNGGNIKWGSGGTDFYYQRDSRSQLTPEEQKLSSTGLAYAGGSESVHVFLPGDGANQGGLGMSLSPQGLQFIANNEGFPNHQPYNDPLGYATAGYGHLLHRSPYNAADVAKYGGMTRAQGLTLLNQDLTSRVAAVNNLVTVTLNQHQFDALVDFTFNVGIGGFGNSTLLREINTGNFGDVPTQPLRWTNGGNQGLIDRRNVEIDLFINGTY